MRTATDLLAGNSLKQLWWTRHILAGNRLKFSPFFVLLFEHCLIFYKEHIYGLLTKLEFQDGWILAKFFFACL